MQHSNPAKGFLILSAILMTVIASGGYNYEKKLDAELEQVLKNQSPGEMNLVWINFRDKGDNTDALLMNPEGYLTQRSIERRQIRIKSGNRFSYSDLPVCSQYISEILQTGINIKQKSKWFNSVSCYASKKQIEILAEKSFVSRIELVKKYRTEHLISNSVISTDNPQQNNSDNPNAINYGPSQNQVVVINVPPVHNLGFNGQGVLIASFDAGFDNLGHLCFDMIRSRGIRSYDFVNGDTIVANGPGRHGNGAHGTITLSLIAGYDPGQLVSPAFGSQYILAKTENTESETPLEEDNWIAAAEWADSLGADIITSSIGYLTFNDPYKSYTWKSMDGNTARITIAADIAVGKGIIVVVSAGNAGFNPEHNTLSAPADGDSVITVGAVFQNKQRWAYSSVGPTVDGRIKPEIMAMGVNNYTARFGEGGVGYLNSASGTSLSCPMVAGVCALILSANNSLSPMEVKNILLSSADSSLYPNNLRGYGNADAYASIRKALNLNLVTDYELGQNFPNPFNPSTTFRLSMKKNAIISLLVYDVTGRLVNEVVKNRYYEVGNNQINYTNSSLGSGVYFYSLYANGRFVGSKKMVIVR